MRPRALRKQVHVFGRDGLLLLHQLCSILTVAHERGIVHRDLKPGNIMLVPDPAVSVGKRVKLLDFGIAKLLDDSLRLAGAPRRIPRPAPARSWARRPTWPPSSACPCPLMCRRMCIQWA